MLNNAGDSGAVGVLYDDLNASDVIQAPRDYVGLNNV